MIKSIIKIALIILLPLMLTFYIIFQIDLDPVVDKFNSQTTHIYISNNDNILVKQTIDVKGCISANEENFSKEIYKFSIPIYDIHRYQLHSWNSSSNISLFSNNNQKKGDIDIERLEVKKEQYNQFIKELEQNNYKVTFSHKIDSKKILSYTDNTENILLYLNGNNKFKSYNVLYLHMPDNTEILNKDKYIEKLDQNTYKVDLKKQNLDYEIKIGGDLKIDVSSKPKYIETRKFSDIYIALYFFSFIAFICIILVVLAYIQKRTKIQEGNYERNPKNVINPILAESIIDGKVDAKDLIMTVLVNLIYKKKIENVDNNSIKLVDASDLSDIEKEVLRILFSTKYQIEDNVGKVVKISELKNSFKEDNKKTSNIYEKFKEIKRLIKTQLVELGVLSYFWNIALKQIRIISYLMIFNITVILTLGIENLFQRLNQQWLPIIIMNLFIYIINFFDIGPKNIKPGIVAIYITIYPIILILGFTVNLYNIDKEIIISFFILIIIYILIIKFSNTYVLTKKGKKEYEKAYMLKKFLMDYSLIKQRDIDGVVIFDEYLIYAVAYGIPTKITSKINETLLNVNIKLQMISKILSL